MRVGIANRTVDGTIAKACLELIAPQYKGLTLKVVEVSLNAATQTVLGLGFPAAIGITPTTPVTGIFEGAPGTPSVPLGQTALAWGTGPTVPAAFIERVTLVGAVGSYQMWTWEEGLYVSAGKSIVLWNIAANSVLDVNLEWIE